MKKQLHVISDGKLPLKEFADIAGKINPFVDRFHLREKQLTAKEIAAGVEMLINKGIPSGKIVVNDRADIAWSYNTCVQLAYHSLPVNLVKQHFPGITAGCSVHSYNDALEAVNGGADFLLYGHIFETPSKEGLPGKGLHELESIKEIVEVPVIVIGGIKPENVELASSAGADGAAVMSGILHAEDPCHAAECYSQIIHQGGGFNEKDL
ncbi:thiamine phosphate synthase [Mesobacillus jeotgali]|uniref:thiamine phosphate synthase n=1 Tax=Mesobacillus jeotgali TaxID=129985 RepID=UPI0009A8D2A8|nr:thiamine phosphate synthase [Mesobacillus jeotgali]